MTKKIELIALLLLFFECLVTVNIMWLFLTVHRVGFAVSGCGISCSDPLTFWPSNSFLALLDCCT